MLKLNELAGFLLSEFFLRILAAIIVAVVFFVVGHYLPGKLLSKATHLEAGFIQRLSTIISLFLYVIGVVAALSILSLSYATLEIVLIIIALLLLIAFRDLLANAVGELYIRFRVPFNEGEWIKIGEVEGRVVTIRTFDVELVTSKGDRIIVPNSYFLKNCLIKKVGISGGISEFSILIRGIAARELEKVLSEALQHVRPELSGSGEIKSLKRDKNVVRITVALPLLNLLKAEKIVNEFIENIRSKGYEVEML